MMLGIVSLLDTIVSSLGHAFTPQCRSIGNMPPILEDSIAALRGDFSLMLRENLVITLFMILVC
jgi:hypothetical protein